MVECGSECVPKRVPRDSAWLYSFSLVTGVRGRGLGLLWNILCSRIFMVELFLTSILDSLMSPVYMNQILECAQIIVSFSSTAPYPPGQDLLGLAPDSWWLVWHFQRLNECLHFLFFGKMCLSSCPSLSGTFCISRLQSAISQITFPFGSRSHRAFEQRCFRGCAPQPVSGPAGGNADLIFFFFFSGVADSD